MALLSLSSLLSLTSRDVRPPPWGSFAIHPPASPAPAGRPPQVVFSAVDVTVADLAAEIYGVADLAATVAESELHEVAMVVRDVDDRRCENGNVEEVVDAAERQRQLMAVCGAPPRASAQLRAPPRTSRRARGSPSVCHCLCIADPLAASRKRHAPSVRSSVGGRGVAPPFERRRRCQHAR